MSHKTFDFSKQGGMPLNQQRLEYMQQSYTEALQAVSNLMGDMVIVSGCVVNGNNVTDGWVVVGGELLPFRTGTNTGTFMVRESSTNLEFKDGQNKPVQISRYCEFGLGIGSYNWSALTRLSTIKQQLADLNSLKTDNEKLKNRIIMGEIPYDLPLGGDLEKAIRLAAPDGINPTEYFGVLNLPVIETIVAAYYIPEDKQIVFYLVRNHNNMGQSGKAKFMLIKKEL